MRAKDHQPLPHPLSELTTAGREKQNADLIARIEQCAQLSADCAGYRQRLEAAKADRAQLVAALREVLHPDMDAWHNLSGENAAKVRTLLRTLGEL